MEEKDRNDLLTRLDERMAFVQSKVVRIEEAVYGNGKPGIIQDIGSVAKRIEKVEQTERDCPIEEVRKYMANVQSRHEAEDEIEKKRQARREKETSEFIKFRWTLLATLVTSIVSFVANLIN